jgi:hypothetical protein
MRPDPSRPSGHADGCPRAPEAHIVYSGRGYRIVARCRCGKICRPLSKIFARYSAAEAVRQSLNDSLPPRQMAHITRKHEHA